MATIDIQYAHRNNERRISGTVGGELIPSENGSLPIGDLATVCSLPKNVVLTGIKVVGIGLGTATVPTVTIDSVAYTLAASDIDDDVVELVVAAPVLLTDAKDVNFSADAIVSAGRVVVLVEFIEFDLTNGNRVEAV
jgi:hypothetical protein